MEGGQSGTYLRLTRASSGPQVSVATTYRNEPNENECFGQITVAFLSNRIQESLECETKNAKQNGYSKLVDLVS